MLSGFAKKEYNFKLNVSKLSDITKTHPPVEIPPVNKHNTGQKFECIAFVVIVILCGWWLKIRGLCVNKWLPGVN